MVELLLSVLPMASPQTGFKIENVGKKNKTKPTTHTHTKTPQNQTQVQPQRISKKQFCVSTL